MDTTANLLIILLYLTAFYMLLGLLSGLMEKVLELVARLQRRRRWLRQDKRSKRARRTVRSIRSAESVPHGNTKKNPGKIPAADQNNRRRVAA